MIALTSELREHCLMQDADVLGHQAEVLGHQADVLGHQADVLGHQADVLGHQAEDLALRLDIHTHSNYFIYLFILCMIYYASQMTQ